MNGTPKLRTNDYTCDGHRGPIPQATHVGYEERQLVIKPRGFSVHRGRDRSMGEMVVHGQQRSMGESNPPPISKSMTLSLGIATSPPPNRVESNFRIGRSV